MRVVFRSPSRLLKSATLFVAVTTLFLATAKFAQAANGNGNVPHAFRVVDRHGKLVGYSLTDNLVARQINGVWVTFYAHPGTGIFDSRAIYLYYLTSDCSGTPYVTHYSNFSEGTRVGSTMYYPTDAQELTPRSLRVASGDGEPGLCSLAPNVSGVFGVATTVDVDSFGLEPPFKAVD
jgi:hypothetical protein